MFLNRLRMEHVSGKTEWLIHEPFRYELADKSCVITVPAGFVTDLTSVPRILFTIFPRDGKYLEAAIIHDYLYSVQKDCDGNSISRKFADKVFLEAMKSLNVRWTRRRAIYVGVRTGGWVAWNV